MGGPRVTDKTLHIKAGQAAVLSYLGHSARSIADIQGVSVPQAYNRISQGVDKIDIPAELCSSVQRIHKQMTESLDRIGELIQIPIREDMNPTVMANVSKAAFMVMDKTLGYVQRLQEREAMSKDHSAQPDKIDETQAIADLNTSVQRLNDTLAQRTAHTAIDAEHEVLDDANEAQSTKSDDCDASSGDQCEKDSNQ